MAESGLDGVAVAVARWLAPYVAEELARPDADATAPARDAAAVSTTMAPAAQGRREWRGRVSSTGVPTQKEMVPLIVEALEALGGEADRHDIVSKALELGAFSEEQMAVEPPPSQVGRYDTKVHYHLAWAMNLAKNEGLIERVEHGRWRLAR